MKMFSVYLQSNDSRFAIKIHFLSTKKLFRFCEEMKCTKKGLIRYHSISIRDPSISTILSWDKFDDIAVYLVTCSIPESLLPGNHIQLKSDGDVTMHGYYGFGMKELIVGEYRKEIFVSNIFDTNVMKLINSFV